MNQSVSSLVDSDLPEIAPDPELIRYLIPSQFIDNGPSSPFRFLYPFIYSAEVRAVLYYAARTHDWLFWYGTLFGSGTEHLTFEERNRVYRILIENRGHSRVAVVHYKTLQFFGRIAFYRAGRKMRTMGDETIVDYLDRKGIPDWVPQIAVPESPLERP